MDLTSNIVPFPLFPAGKTKNSGIWKTKGRNPIYFYFFIILGPA